jgi:protein SMG8
MLKYSIKSSEIGFERVNGNFSLDFNFEVIIKLSNCIQIPAAGVWFEVSNKAFNFFLSSDQLLDSKSKQQQLLSSLRGLLDTDVRFSEGRCGKVLPLAIATYQENLPPQYTRDYHESKVIPSTCLEYLYRLYGVLVQNYQ